MKFEGIGDVMTEKIRLNDGTEFTLIPMGIEDIDAEKLRLFKITTDLPITEVITKFSDANAISYIEYILADNAIGAIYQDCTDFKSVEYIPNMQINDNTIAKVLIVKVSTDLLERKIVDLQNNINSTQEYIKTAIAELTILMAAIGNKQ